MTTEGAGVKRKEIYTYQAPWLIYGMNWSVRADQRFRLAIGSFEEEYSNSVRIIQLDEETHQFVDNGGFEHPYPTTKIMWIPDQNGTRRDLLATTGDYLRLWNVNDNKSVRLECLLNNVRARTARPVRAPAPARPESAPSVGGQSLCLRARGPCAGGLVVARALWPAPGRAAGTGRRVCSRAPAVRLTLRCARCCCWEASPSSAAPGRLRTAVGAG